MASLSGAARIQGSLCSITSSSFADSGSFCHRCQQRLTRPSNSWKELNCQTSVFRTQSSITHNAVHSCHRKPHGIDFATHTCLPDCACTTLKCQLHRFSSRSCTSPKHWVRSHNGMFGSFSIQLETFKRSGARTAACPDICGSLKSVIQGSDVQKILGKEGWRWVGKRRPSSVRVARKSIEEILPNSRTPFEGEDAEDDGDLIEDSDDEEEEDEERFSYGDEEDGGSGGYPSTESWLEAQELGGENGVRSFPDDDALLQRGETFVERVFELCTKVQATGGSMTITSSNIQALYDFRIDKFQRLSIEAFLEGNSVVVCAPTSSGKTLIAEAAAAATLARGRRLFYTTPLKALSNQKLREFREKFGEGNVGLLTGDAAVNREAPIVVMTTEIVRNMLYSSAWDGESGGRLTNVDMIVLDEVHYLSDVSRGTVWEETIIYCPKEVQLICLSATIANPEELADWISRVHGPTELVTSTRRPVPLMWHFSTRHALIPLLNQTGDQMNRYLAQGRAGREADAQEEALLLEDWAQESMRWGVKRGLSRGRAARDSRGDPRVGREDMAWNRRREMLLAEEDQLLRRRQVPQIRHTLLQLKERDMLPAIWFIFSRRGCDTAVSYVQEVQLLSASEQAEVRQAVAELQESFPEAVRERALVPLYQGVAAHHAGCLPLWKSFVEELFQRGLVKVVFSTETLAAGINMPARTTVLSSLSKRGDDGQESLSANAMLQMAGRAGRRGIDEQGHVVVVQTPFEGPEECCKLLFAGPDPLVSQFTATYGMALNLLAETRTRGGDMKTSKAAGDMLEADVEMSASPEDSRVVRGRTMEEARALIEKSFANYLGSDVVVEARRQLASLEIEIAELEALQREDEASMERWQEKSKADPAWASYFAAKAELRAEKKALQLLSDRVDVLRHSAVEPRLVATMSTGSCAATLRYTDARTGDMRMLDVRVVDRVPRPAFVVAQSIPDSEESEDDEEADVDDNEWSERSAASEGPAETDPSTTATNGGGRGGAPREFSYFVGLGADNCWYVFTVLAVQGLRAGGPGEDAGERRRERVEELELVARRAVQGRLRDVDRWRRIGRTGSQALEGAVWVSEGTVQTRSLSSQIPLLVETSQNDIELADELAAAESALVERRLRKSEARKRMKATPGYRERRKALAKVRKRLGSIARRRARSERIASRLSRMQPTGWKEFVQLVRVLRRTGAVEGETHALLPLGKTAAAVRGTNELWLALVFTDADLLTLAPPQLAATCASLVAAGVKSRPGSSGSSMYEPSAAVLEYLAGLQSRRLWLAEIQSSEGVQIPLDIDTQFAGLAEAWASGVTWKQLTADLSIDEGDVARLLRRTIDALAQIPFLPNVDRDLSKTARQVADLMDRPPISELVG